MLSAKRFSALAIGLVVALILSSSIFTPAYAQQPGHAAQAIVNASPIPSFSIFTPAYAQQPGHAAQAIVNASPIPSFFRNHGIPIPSSFRNILIPSGVQHMFGQNTPPIPHITTTIPPIDRNVNGLTGHK